jgi:hypothetical protein
MYRKDFDGQNAQSAPGGTPGSDSGLGFEQTYSAGNVKVFEDGKTRVVTKGGPGLTQEKGRKEGVIRSWRDNIGSMGDGAGKPSGQRG